MRVLSLFLLGAIISFSGCVRTAPVPTEPAAKIARSPETISVASNPGEAHKVLASLVGDWDYAISLWMEPNEEPKVLVGSSRNSMIYGGRHLVQEYWGEAIGEPFLGQAITSFDNVRGEYSTVYVDNMSTGMMTSKGSYDAATRSITETGSFSCPVSGEKNIASRSVLTVEDADRYKYESFNTYPGSPEVKLMEIKFVRRNSVCNCPSKSCPGMKKPEGAKHAGCCAKDKGCTKGCDKTAGKACHGH